MCNRTRGGGCPFCAGVRVSVTACLSTRNPEIAAEWYPTKNGDLTPRDLVAGSTHVAWWKCDKGPDHEWQAPLSKRTLDGSGSLSARGSGTRQDSCRLIEFTRLGSSLWSSPDRVDGLTMLPSSRSSRS